MDILKKINQYKKRPQTGHMNKLTIKIFIFLSIALMAIKVQAQEIKFPESFRAEKSILKGMRFAEIPQQAQTEYGINKNPGLITDASKTKGFLMSGKLQNVQAVYFEIYKDLEDEKMSFCFEVAEFTSVAEMEKILPKTDKQSESVILLTVKNYLIMIYGPSSNYIGNRLDDMAKYFQHKLDAKLIRNRKKDVEIAFIDGSVSNLPPPPPPEPKNAPISIDLNEVEYAPSYQNGFAYLRNKKRQKFAPGNYRASTTFPDYETLTFTINQDSLLTGTYEYSYAKDFREEPIKETKVIYDNGVKISETHYLNNKFQGSTVSTSTVVKEGKDYLITINTSIKNPSAVDKEIKTVFRNRKPISKITTRLGVSVIRKDFEKNYLDEFNSKGQLTKLEKPGLIEKYNNAGKVTYKEVWIGDNQFVYQKEILRQKKIRVKGKDQYLVTEYDAAGKVIAESSKGIEIYTVVANSDESESEMTEMMFEYYKKLFKNE